MDGEHTPAPATQPAVLPAGRKGLSGPLLGLLALLLLFVLILARKGQLGNFLGLSNIQGMLHSNAAIAVLALGMLLILITGGIDLSVGSVVALVTVVTMQVYRIVEAQTGSVVASTVQAILAGVATGGACGLINGLAITRLKVSPFVATLGMWSIARGLAQWVAGRVVISFPGPRPEWVRVLETAEVPWWQGLVSPAVWSVLLLAVAVAVVLRTTVFGRYCYAIGSNEATARLCGIDTDRQKLYVYVVAGLLTGWAGILVFARSGSGDPGGSIGMELDVIAAVVIGGASLGGGQGTVTGTLLGVLILGILLNGVSFSQVPVEIKHIFIGVIVIVNTALSQWQRHGTE